MRYAHRNNFFIEALWQGALIVMIAIILSLAVNHFRQGGVPLVRERVSSTPNAGSSEQVKAGAPAITIEEARALFLTNGAD